jgi:hypothetical protein
VLGAPVFLSTRSAKLRLSGQTPESMTPMITSSPVLGNVHLSRRASTRPRNAGVDEVSTVCISSGVTETTSALAESLLASAWVISAANPLNV